jgi:hypothetical protein
MKRRRFLFGAFVLTACAVQIEWAAELQPTTLLAWNEYVRKADLRMQDRAASRAPFLLLDESADRAARLRRGEVVIAPVVGQGSQQIDHGLIHDWIGAVFIPGATLDKVLSVIRDYDNYQNVYQPVVALSKMLACSDSSQEFQMVWQRKVLFVRAAMQGRYQAHGVILDSHHGYSVAEAVEMREIEGYRHSGERLLPPDTGHGFIWRIRSVARFEERDGGVYLELEALALTRDVPASLSWLVNPVVNHLSVDSLTTTLRQTRDAVFKSRGTVEAVASCRTPARGSALAKTGGEE